MSETLVPAPFGDVGLQADRDTSGRFIPGDRAALIAAQDSVEFWKAHAARRPFKGPLRTHDWQGCYTAGG